METLFVQSEEVTGLIGIICPPNVVSGKVHEAVV